MDSYIARAVRKPLDFSRRLRRNDSGVAFVEFAFTAPIVLGLGLMGTETAHYVVTHMQLSQIAVQVADNVSRVGEQDVLVEKKVFENDVNEVFVGAEKLGGEIDLFENGRVIISSLQVNDDGGQWIAWQRCRGKKEHDSSHGVEGAGAEGTTFIGMGDGAQKITASPGTAVMFVELSYTYQSVTPFNFLTGREIEYTAAFNIRDSRDLTRLHGAEEDAEDPQPQSLCSVYSAGVAG